MCQTQESGIDQNQANHVGKPKITFIVDLKHHNKLCVFPFFLYIRLVNILTVWIGCHQGFKVANINTIMSQ